MAAPVRFYLTNAAAGYTPPTVRGTWNDAALTGASMLSPVKAGAGTTAAKAETSATNNFAVLLRRFVSDPINNATTLDGAVSLCLGVLESNSAANDNTRVYIYVTVGSTDVVRGALTATAQVGAAEWPTSGFFGGSAQAQTLTIAALSGVAVSPGDRVVVEIGYRAANTVTTSYSGTINYGGTGSDLTDGNTNVSTRPGWVEFSGAGFTTAFSMPVRSGTVTSNTGPVSTLPLARKRRTASVTSATGPSSTLPTARKAMRTTSATGPVSTVTGQKIVTASVTSTPTLSVSGVAEHLSGGAEAVTQVGVRSIPVAHIEGDIELPPPDIDLIDNPGRPPIVRTLRFIAQDIRTHRFLDWDLPLVDPEITWTLSGPTVISAKLRPEYLSLAELNIDPWATWIHVEVDGQVVASGILQPTSVDDEEYTVEAIGVAGYPQGIPYFADDSFIQTDVCDVLRRMWAHLQSYPDAALGVTVSDAMCGTLLGIPSLQALDDQGVPQYDEQTIQPDTPPEQPDDRVVSREEDPDTGVIVITYADGVILVATPRMEEAKPYVLAWYNDTDIGAEFDNLAKIAKVDYVETCAWNDAGTDITHHIELGYPRIGRKRFDLRCALDESLLAAFVLSETQGQYASQVLVRGKGQGRAAIRGYAGSSDPHRIRRVAIVTDQTIGDVAGANAYAVDEILRRRAAISIDELVLDADHPDMPLGSYTCGDDVLVTARIAYAGDIELWHRIISYTWVPSRNQVSAKVRRSEQFGYGAPYVPPLPPDDGEPVETDRFTLAFGSCINASDSGAFTAIKNLNPDYFAILGDVWYDDGGSGHAAHWQAKFTAPKYKAMLDNLPNKQIVGWSDHEGFAPNATAGPAWTLANAAYRSMNLAVAALPANGIYQTWTRGRIRFILLDQRTFKSPNSATDNSSKTMLGSTQKAWLQDLVADDTYPLIVILGDGPWAAPAVVGEDAWRGYDTERRQIGAWYAASPAAIVELEGDSHSLGKAHNAFGVDRVWRAAPFHNATKVAGKGEGYDENYPTNKNEGPVMEQFGLVTFFDAGPVISVTFQGYSGTSVKMTDSLTVHP